MRSLSSLFVVLATAYGSRACDATPVSFPIAKGWIRDGDRQRYGRENLFDYVDGAAELYLSYGFLEVATESYRGAGGDCLTVDVFSFSTERDAFGMYSRERPRTAAPVCVGVDGYVQNSVLCFCKGCYYARLTGYSVDGSMEKLLRIHAESLAAELAGTSDCPPPLTWFPSSGKIARSEQYIARDFLGHGFLSSAYAAEYAFDAETFLVFIVEADDAAGAQRVLQHYLELAGTPEELLTAPGTIRLLDPYHESAGPLHLQQRDKYILGVFNDDPHVYEPLLDGLSTQIPPDRGTPLPMTRSGLHLQS